MLSLREESTVLQFLLGRLARRECDVESLLRASAMASPEPFLFLLIHFGFLEDSDPSGSPRSPGDDSVRNRIRGRRPQHRAFGAVSSTQAYISLPEAREVFGCFTCTKSTFPPFQSLFG